MNGKLSDEQAVKLRVIKAYYDAITLCKKNLEEMNYQSSKEYTHPQ